MEIRPKTEQGIVNRSPNTFFRYHGWPTVAIAAEGVLYAVDSGFRVSHVCPFGQTAMYKSFDGGRTWSDAEKTEIPNNNCGIDAVRMESGRLVLVYNPVRGNWAARTPIAFSVSDDNGETWSEPQILDHQPCGENNVNYEFSYPAVLAQGQDIFITYTWKRQTVAFWQIRFL